MTPQDILAYRNSQGLDDSIFSNLKAEAYQPDEPRLEELVKSPNVPVIYIPALISDANSPAMEKILGILSQYSSLDIIVGIDGAKNQTEFNETRDMILDYIPSAFIINNNSKPMQDLYKKEALEMANELKINLEELKTKYKEEFSNNNFIKALKTFTSYKKLNKFIGEISQGIKPGKGRNAFSSLAMKRYLSSINFLSKDRAVAMIDSDIKTFDKPFFSRLLRPYIEERYDFTKAFFKRVGYDQNNEKRMFGRVRRLFVAPFLDSLYRLTEENKEAQGLITFLRSIKYPLSGEVVFSDKALGEFKTPLGWDLEISSLIQYYEHNKENIKCNIKETNLGEYDHKHDFSGKKGELPSKLFRMSSEIATSVLSVLNQKYGVDIYSPKFKQELGFEYEFASNFLTNRKFKKAAEQNGCKYNPQNEFRDSMVLFNKSLEMTYKALDKQGGHTLLAPKLSDEKINEMSPKLKEALLNSHQYTLGRYSGIKKAA